MCKSVEAGECMGTECGPAGEGARNAPGPGEATPCCWAAEGELEERKLVPAPPPLLGDVWGSMVAGEGLGLRIGGGDARENPLVAGLDTKPAWPPPPCQISRSLSVK